MPITNAEVVESLVKEAMEKHNINLGALSGDVNDGTQTYGFAAKQLLDARKGKDEVSQAKLTRIADRLSELLDRKIDWKTLLKTDEDLTKEKLEEISIRLSELLGRKIDWKDLIHVGDVRSNEARETDPASVTIKGEATDGGIVVNAYQSETHFHQDKAKK